MEINHAHNAITGANFGEEVLQSQEPVILEFWTEGCKPCQKLGGIIRKYSGQIKIAPCNIDENPDTPGKYGVRGIPTKSLTSRMDASNSTSANYSQLSTNGSPPPRN